MSKIIEALKNLAVAMGCAETTGAVTGDKVEDVINFIAENIPEETEAQG